MEMVKQAQESKKNAEPSPDDQKKLASANLDKVRADQIQAEVAGNTASAQLEGYALLEEGKAKSYGT
jgi:hypothetical protein